MKEIYFVRHASAVPFDEGSDDIERHLVKEGKKNSKTMSRELKKSGKIPKLLISSPAARAIETAEQFAKEFSYPYNKIVIKNAIYDSDSAGIIQAVKKLNDKYDSVMIFGHNPTLSDTVSELAKDYSDSMPKTGVVCLRINRNRWANIVRSQGIVAFTCTLDDLIKRKENTLQVGKEIEEHLPLEIINFLSERGVPVSKKTKKYISAVSYKIARKAQKEIGNGGIV